jgi:hypothetical protein
MQFSGRRDLWSRFNLVNLPKALPITMTKDKTQCQTCAFLLASESSETQFRCGIEYFSQPPSMRQAQKMNNYRPVQPSDSCGQWQKHAPSVLSEKFT